MEQTLARLSESCSEVWLFKSHTGMNPWACHLKLSTKTGILIQVQKSASSAYEALSLADEEFTKVCANGLAALPAPIDVEFTQTSQFDGTPF